MQMLTHCPECEYGIEGTEPHIPCVQFEGEEGMMYECTCPECCHVWVEGPYY
jgi:hypothetical protein